MREGEPESSDRLSSKPSADALVPHLSATLMMNWASPPSSIVDRLCTLSDAPNCTRECLNLLSVRDRCGAGATNAVARLASQQTPISFEDMCRVQGHVVGMRNAKFRRASGYARQRNERYAYFGSLEQMFRKKVSVDNQDSCHPLMKAVRLYLDLIFVHPFPNGNARAALLWFTFYCMRYRYCVPDFRKFFDFGFSPGSRTCYWQFCSIAIDEVNRVSSSQSSFLER